MKSRAFWWTIPVATVLALVIVSAALAQNPKCKEFQGVSNAYTAQTKTTAGPVPKSEPWTTHYPAALPKD
jgi:hypothetical protein